MNKVISGLGVFLFWVGLAAAASAQDTAGSWGIGLRGGAGFLGQDVDQDAEGLTGTAASITVTHRVTNALSLGAVNEVANFLFLSPEDAPSALAVGVDVAWASHKIKSKVDGFNFGVADTILVLPHAEIRSHRFDDVTPYLLLGVGLNFNSFRESPEFAALCVTNPCNIERVYTVAFKVAGGGDYFLTPRLAWNTELGWTYNDRDVDPKISTLPTLNGIRTSGFTLLTGLRYYF
jgi:hypothetical protein